MIVPVKSTRLEVYKSLSEWTEDEKNILWSSNFDNENIDQTFSSIVDELLLKVGNEKYCFISNDFVGIESDNDEALIFEGNLEDILNEMDAYY